uniref:Uncharacterized protein n=1 Tax=Lepeophtheirus salmonis TaxID=72036 RepID=A0A0K2U5U4_LEPSM
MTPTMIETHLLRHETLLNSILTALMPIPLTTPFGCMLRGRHAVCVIQTLRLSKLLGQHDRLLHLQWVPGVPPPPGSHYCSEGGYIND